MRRTLDTENTRAILAHRTRTFTVGYVATCVCPIVSNSKMYEQIFNEMLDHGLRKSSFNFGGVLDLIKAKIF